MAITSNTEPTQQVKNPPKYTVLLTIIVILLTAIVIMDGFQIMTTYQQNEIAEQRAASYKQRVQEAESLVVSQQKIIAELLTEYEKAAYANPSIERIAEQQLLVEEFNLTALQIIALQNSQIIELLANSP